MIGVLKQVWAMMITVGEYTKPNAPKGPDLENNKNIKRPMTTGGNPINVFATLMMKVFPLYFFTPRKIPKGIPMAAAMRVDPKETWTENPKISHISGLKVKIKYNASANILDIEFQR